MKSVSAQSTKKKKVNRNAKLKLDAKREQWPAEQGEEAVPAGDMSLSPKSVIHGPKPEGSNSSASNSSAGGDSETESCSTNQEDVCDGRLYNSNTVSNTISCSRRRGERTEFAHGNHSPQVSNPVGGHSVWKTQSSKPGKPSNRAGNSPGARGTSGMKSNPDTQPRPGIQQAPAWKTGRPGRYSAGKTNNTHGPARSPAWKPEYASRRWPASQPERGNKVKARVVPEEESELCPICVEVMDATDLAFSPCSCGLKICLFCHHRIFNEDGRCPGCRSPYTKST